jgi:hypothetical protein
MVKFDREKTYTVEEYLTLEAQSELRHEFFYGNLYELWLEIQFLMSGW